MSYVLSVDLGTTFTTAAVCPIDGEPKMLTLGSSGYAVPSALFLRDDGTFIAGEAAELRSSADPTRVARYFKRRLGDEVPIRLAGTPFAPQALVTNLLGWVIGQSTERNGAAPTSVVLTHPANWGPYRRELLQQAAAMAGAARALLISEPEAAAIHYVQSERIESGELLGIYDLGGGTFDAVVMRRTPVGFEALGQPAGVDRLGGLEFDDVIRSFVLEAADLSDVDQGDEAAVTAAYALQSSCIDAKRVLSADTVAHVRVVFPGISTSVRVTRSEFESRIRPRLLETLSAFQSAVDSAGVTTDDLSRILLVGGSSRVPLVSALLAQRFGRPLAVDSDPKNTVALGAARYGADALRPNPDPPVSPLEADQTHVTPPRRTAEPDPTPIATAPSTPTPTPQSTTPPTPTPQSTTPPSPVPALPSRPTAAAPPTETPPSPAAAAPSQRDEPTSELFSVQAESGHRTRIPRASERSPDPPAPATSDAVEVGPDHRLLVIAAVVALVVVAVIAIAVLAA